MAKYKIILIISAVTLILSTIYFSLDLERDNYNAFSNKGMRFVFSVENLSKSFMGEAHFKFLLPLEIKGRQEVLSVNSNSEFFIKKTNESESYAVITVRSLPPKGTKIVKVDLQIKMSSQPEFSLSNNQYLSQEKYVDYSNQKISSVAKKFPIDDNYPERAFQWMRKNIASEEYRISSKGALHALENRSGDCTEHMYLYMAFARYAGIPARGVKGFVVNKDVESIAASQFHNWAEYYDGDSWRLVDTQKNVFNEDYSQYVVFGFLDGSDSAGRISGFVQTDSEIAIKL